MPSAIRIELQVAGVAEVDRAFRTVEQTTARLEQRVRRTYDNEAAAARKTAREIEREKQRQLREEERIRERGYRENAKIAADEAKAAKKSTDDKLKEEERWADRRLRIQQKSAEMAYRLAEDEVRAVERAEKQKSAARERYARAIGSNVGGFMNRAVSGASTALMLGGGFAVADAVHSQFSASKQAALLVNQVTAGGKPPAGANVNAILSQAAGIAGQANMSKTDVISGALAYSRAAKGGDFAGAMANMEFIAKLSKATGTSVEDIGQAAGMLQSQNATLGADPAAMRQMLLNVYSQSKAGSVSMTDAAKQVGTLASTRGFFAGDEARNQRVLLGLGQIAAPGGSPEEVGTYVKNLAIQGSKHHKELAAMGVKFNVAGQMESPEQMIAQVFKGTGGDLGKIEKLFGSRGMPVFTQLASSFRGAGGGDAGVAAVQKAIGDVTSATMSEKDLDSQFQQTMSTPAEKFGATIEKLEDKLAERLEPTVEHLADTFDQWEPQIEQMVGDFADAIAWLGEHPWTGLGLVVAAEVTKEIGKAAIGEAVKQTIVSLMTGQGVPTGGAGGAGAKVLAGAVGLVGGWELGKWGIGKLLGRTDEEIEATDPSSTWDWFSHGGVVDPNKGNIQVGENFHPKQQGFDVGGHHFYGPQPGATNATTTAPHPDNQRMLALLQRIAENTGSQGGTNAAPNRNLPMSAPQRGGTH